MIAAARRKFNDLHISSQLLILVALLNVVDFQTTSIIAKFQGFDVELNPLLYHLMIVFDTTWVILWAKVIVLTASFLFIRYLVTKRGGNINTATIPLTILVIAFSFVVMWNFYLILQL